MHCDKFIINSISFKEVLADIWHTTAKKACVQFSWNCTLQDTLAWSNDTSSGSGVYTPSVKRLEVFSQWGCIKACTHAHTYRYTCEHTSTSNQTSLNPHMQAGVTPKNNPVLPQVQLLSLLYKGKLSYPRQPWAALFLFPGALPWQQGKMRKIIISWS